LSSGPRNNPATYLGMEKNPDSLEAGKLAHLVIL
jgi:hypothetical protein